MIDRPNGKIEKIIDDLFHFCRKMNDKAKKKGGARWIKSMAAIAGVLVCTFVIVGYVTPETVTVVIDTSLEEKTEVYETTTRTVEAFIEEHEIDYIDGQDEMDVMLDDKIKDNMEIHITKAFDVKVIADGETTEITILPMSAGQVLNQLGIKVGENDIVEPSEDTMLVSGDEVVVKRVTFGKDSEKETISYEVLYQEDSSMQIGKMELSQEGREGKLKHIYKVKYIDGKEVSRELVDTKTLKSVKDKIYSYGTAITSGAPDSYEKVYTGVRAVSYYFSGNPSGAYGLPCTYGTCAVDPDLIPLGSLLYIEGYGYAVANDVGTGVKGKVVDVYMEKYEQCLIWGARYVKVYVVDEA